MPTETKMVNLGSCHPSKLLIKESSTLITTTNILVSLVMPTSLMLPLSSLMVTTPASSKKTELLLPNPSPELVPAESVLNTSKDSLVKSPSTAPTQLGPTTRTSPEILVSKTEIIDTGMPKLRALTTLVCSMTSKRPPNNPSLSSTPVPTTQPVLTPLKNNGRVLWKSARREITYASSILLTKVTPLVTPTRMLGLSDSLLMLACPSSLPNLSPRSLVSMVKELVPSVLLATMLERRIKLTLNSSFWLGLCTPTPLLVVLRSLKLF